MTITEQYINDYKDIKLKFTKLNYPQPCNANLPKMFFVSLAIGSRGSGKTYSIVQLLKQYEKSKILDPVINDYTDQRIILFSPTHNANPVFESLKHLDKDDTIDNYSDDKLLEVIEDIKNERKLTEEYQEYNKIYQKFLRCKDEQLKGFSYDELMILHKYDFGEMPPPKYPRGCVVFMVLDDLVGSSAFKSTGRSALTNLVLKNRHLKINIIIATQNLKAIPKSIRTNTSLFIVFNYASKKIIVEDLYEEVSNTLTIEKFEEVYTHATNEEHTPLVIDFTQDKSNRFKKGFSTLLNVS
jgi:hypothetical protein